MRSRWSLRVLPVTTLVVAFLAAWSGESEAAVSGERGWVLRVGPTWFDSDRGDGLVIGHESGEVSGMEARDVGLSVSGEYRLSPRVGLEVGLLATSDRIGARDENGAVVSGGTSSYGSLTLGPDIHLAPDGPADLFFGPFLTYTARTDVGYHQDEWAGVRVTGSFGWGALLGVDVPVGERGWRVCTSVRYLDTNLDGTDGNGDHFDLDSDGTAVGVGVGYRF